MPLTIQLTLQQRVRWLADESAFRILGQALKARRRYSSEEASHPTSPLGRELFRSHPRPSNPLLPPRGGVYPSLNPFPWTWTGGARGVRAPKIAQDGFKRASASPR